MTDYIDRRAQLLCRTGWVLSSLSRVEFERLRGKARGDRYTPVMPLSASTICQAPVTKRSYRSPALAKHLLPKSSALVQVAARKLLYPRILDPVVFTSQIPFEMLSSRSKTKLQPHVLSCIQLQYKAQWLKMAETKEASGKTSLWRRLRSS